MHVIEVIDRLRWPVLLASAILSSTFIAWQLLVSVNFLYPLWHKALHIDDTVRIYGPQNRNRHGFEQTTDKEHARLFAAIVHAVVNGGRNLESLEYRDATGKPIGLLLTQPEIVHLQDVARLVGAFKTTGWISLLVFIGIGMSSRQRQLPKPALKKSLSYLALIVTLGCGALLAIGPKAVFYKMHTLIFPLGHQWFFYYQDSLMTTLMKAPDLFAAIAVEWLIITMITSALLLALWARCVPGRRSGHSPDLRTS